MVSWRCFTGAFFIVLPPTRNDFYSKPRNFSSAVSEQSRFSSRENAVMIYICRLCFGKYTNWLDYTIKLENFKKSIQISDGINAYVYWLLLHSMTHLCKVVFIASRLHSCRWIRLIGKWFSPRFTPFLGHCRFLILKLPFSALMVHLPLRPKRH